MRAKQLNKGLLELGEEGAVQVFEPFVDNTLLIGAVGQLQFEVVAHRLKTEYGVDASFENAGIYTARWVTCPDAQHLAEFTKANHAQAGEGRRRQPGVSGRHAGESALAQERWPKVAFHDTREHGQVMS